MREFLTALVISGGIFAVMMVSQFGRREYTLRKVLIPVVSVAAFGYTYLRHIPSTGGALWLYAVGIGIGAVFGLVATVTTGVEKDAATKRLYTRTGVGFVLTWFVAVTLRVGFVWGVDNVATFRQQVGVFMMNHQLVEDSIAPFFVMMALTTVVLRVVVIKVRVNRVSKVEAEKLVPGSVSV